MTPRALAVLQIPTESVFSRAGALVAISFQMVPRVAKVGSISARAKMTIKTFVKRVFTIFATNALFLCIITNLHI